MRQRSNAHKFMLFGRPGGAHAAGSGASPVVWAPHDQRGRQRPKGAPSALGGRPCPSTVPEGPGNQGPGQHVHCRPVAAPGDTPSERRESSSQPSLRSVGTRARQGSVGALVLPPSKGAPPQPVRGGRGRARRATIVHPRRQCVTLRTADGRSMTLGAESMREGRARADGGHGRGCEHDPLVRHGGAPPGDEGRCCALTGRGRQALHPSADVAVTIARRSPRRPGGAPGRR